MKRIGIDAGGSLIKLAYEEKGLLHVKTYSYNQQEQLAKWLQMLAPDAHIYGTGGRWNQLKASMKQPNHTVEEFTAIVQGTNYLLEEFPEKIDEYILVSIGTGTSIFHVKGQSFERVLGSGVGGGTLMGLGSLIAKGKSFRELVELSAKGNHQNSDLLVKDIYGEQHAPLTGELTAANFGKVHLQEEHSEADLLRSLTQLIGEVILSLAGNVAAIKGVGKIVFVGSTVEGNKPLQEVFLSFQEMLSYQPIFPDKAAYAGAIGALLE